MSGPRTFHVVDGSPPPDTEVERARAARRQHPKPPEELRCPSCTSNALMKIMLGVQLKNGKPTGGTPQWICAGQCLVEGRHVVVY